MENNSLKMPENARTRHDAGRGWAVSGLVIIFISLAIGLSISAYSSVGVLGCTAGGGLILFGIFKKL